MILRNITPLQVEVGWSILSFQVIIRIKAYRRVTKARGKVRGTREINAFHHQSGLGRKPTLPCIFPTGMRGVPPDPALLRVEPRRPPTAFTRPLKALRPPLAAPGRKREGVVMVVVTGVSLLIGAPYTLLLYLAPRTIFAVFRKVAVALTRPSTCIVDLGGSKGSFVRTVMFQDLFC